ncbi:MAG TPA: substrate-binding domain-containing protein [Gaiella sp.]|jgi:branched-chain amino acid transport system substrate-binding protein|nr:substrate-binding domain-containing protein [Gaiella sp.]
MKGWFKLAVLAAALAALAGVGASARGADAAPSAKAPIKVGIVYSRTGLLAAYGAQYVQGLRYGLAYATKGTNAVNGQPIELTLVDDAGDPVKAVSAAKDLIGKGYKVLAGSTSSGVALQVAPLAEQNKILFISGPAATDAVTGINKYTFRSGRQSYQDVLAASSYLGAGGGKTVTVFAQDSAFGLGNYLAVNQVMGNRGGQKVNRILVPLSAQDFTPFAQQIKQQKTDLLFIAWAGTTAPAMWRALDQQGVFDSVDHVVTGLDMRASYPTFGPVANKISFLSHYVSNAPKNKVNDFLVNSMRKRGQVPDLFTPDGFVAGQMIAHALTASPSNVDQMISSLEGWSFTGPKGQQTIRASDHAMLQPMFQVKLVQNGGKYQTVVLKRLRAKYTAPPEANGK